MAYTVSEVSLCNQALIELGARTISSRTEQSTEAIACNNIFDNLRRQLLGMHPWNFATKQVELAQTTDTPLFDYDYEFKLPTDLLRVWKVDGDGDYKIHEDKILSNKQTCKIEYIFDNTNVTTWTPQFNSLFVAALAYKISYAITASSTHMERTWKLYQEQFQLARTINATEDIQDQYGQFDSILLSSRESY